MRRDESRDESRDCAEIAAAIRADAARSARRFGELFQYRLGGPGSPTSPGSAAGWGVLEMSGRGPARRSSHVAAGFDDRLFLFGGFDGANFIGDLHCTGGLR